MSALTYTVQVLKPFGQLIPGFITKQLRSLFMQRWTLQTLQTTFGPTILPFLLQDLQVWRLACTGAWKRDRSKRTASFGLCLRCPRTGSGTSTLVVSLPTGEEELLLEPELPHVWPLAPLNTSILKSFRGSPFTPRALLSRRDTSRSICDTDINDICKQTPVPPLGLHGGAVEVY